MVVAGEASGDVNGAHLAASLKKRLPGIVIEGVGGREMRDVGVSIIYDSSTWGAIGIVESLKVVPGLMLALSNLREQLRVNPPDLLILIDFGAFNTRLGRIAHALGIKVLYYFPPGSWSRSSSYKCLDGIADHVITPFPWSADVLRLRGFSADFFGHPLLDTVAPTLSKEEFCGLHGLDPESPIVALLPGSRTQEVVHNLPALMVTAARMRERNPRLQFVVALASSISCDGVTSDLADVPWLDAKCFGECGDYERGIGRGKRLRLSDRVKRIAARDKLVPPGQMIGMKFLSRLTSSALAYSRAAIVTSGTATVEAMILRCPMVIVYGGSMLTAVEYRLLARKIKFIGMPNIVADRMICPELLYNNASPQKIAELTEDLVQDGLVRAAMLRDLEEARMVLGDPDAVDKAAQVVMAMLSRKEPYAQHKEEYAESNGN
jgi:lipid-A-disaccharide synthase